MLKKLFKEFNQEERGAGLLEYVIIIAIVAILAIILFAPLRTAVKNWFNNMIENINRALGLGDGNVSKEGGNTVDEDLNDGWKQ